MSKEKIELLLDTTPSLTKENYGKMSNKFYESGREIKIGDKVMWGYLNEPDGDKIVLKVVLFHISEIGKIYEFHDLDNLSGDSDVPLLKKINTVN